MKICWIALPCSTFTGCSEVDLDMMIWKVKIGKETSKRYFLDLISISFIILGTDFIFYQFLRFLWYFIFRMKYLHWMHLNNTGGFSAHHFCWGCILAGWKRLYSRKYSFFIKFQYFPFWRFSEFPQQKILTINVEKTFSRNNVIWYAFNSKLTSSTDGEKSGFFSKVQFFLLRHPTFVRIWEILLF